jgi:hypothetical protein
MNANDVDGGSRGVIQSWILPAKTEENHEKPRSG